MNLLSEDTRDLSSELQDNDYNRERSFPTPGDRSYLPLCDLLTALRDLSHGLSGRLLDYGCGGSPYRNLFEGCIYHRADFTPLPDLDFLVGNACEISAPDCSYDVVLSTQVLEHVRDYAHYLQEAFRLLKPGGKLILSTHGCFYDHGCPWDFRRWTSDGLMIDLEKHGFQVETMMKLTTNGRALAYLLRNFNWLLRRPRRHPLGMLSWTFSQFLERKENAAMFDRWCDLVTPTEAVVSAEAPGYSLYIGLIAFASKAVG